MFVGNNSDKKVPKGPVNHHQTFRYIRTKSPELDCLNSRKEKAKPKKAMAVVA
jgi:hypothetical protein